jgi:uncharacterized protein (DUF58 family)
MAGLRTRQIAGLAIIVVAGVVVFVFGTTPPLVFFAAAVVLLSVASLLWTTVTARRLLRRALGRPLRENEESSIQTWMRVSEHDREQAGSKLAENPFEAALDAIHSAAEPKERSVYAEIHRLDPRPDPDK